MVDEDQLSKMREFMNLSIKISIFRMFLVPVFMLFIIPIPNWVAENNLNYLNDFILNYGNYFAGVVFIIAAASDTLCGYIARDKNLTTKFGRFIDPVTDNILIAAALISLVERNEVAGWVAVIIISREFIVTGLKIIKARESNVFESGKLEKLKTVLQKVAISFSFYNNLPFALYTQIRIDRIVMLIAVGVTVYSGYEYLMKHRDWIVIDA